MHGFVWNSVCYKWIESSEDPDEKMAQVNAVWATVKNGPGSALNGIKVYEEVCGKCHVHLLWSDFCFS